MAKVNYGTIVNDARGKVNGTVFSKNKSGAYTRRKVTPANPNSTRQSTVRTNFGALSQAWSGSLSDSDRAAWIAYAATYPRLDVFGASIQLTGLNMYISLNQVLMNIGEPSNDTPPATNVVAPIPFDPTSLIAVAAVPTLTFEQTAAPPTMTTEFYVFATRPLPPGRQPANTDFRFMALVSPDGVGLPAAIPIATLYVALFGAWLAGQRMSILVATVDTTTGLTTVGAKMTVIST